MRALIQRVSEASVEIDGFIKGLIPFGLTVFVAFSDDDSVEDVEWVCGKIHRLRLFADEAGKMNLDISNIKGSVLVISQFTLYASVKKGNRPSFVRSSSPEVAIPLYEQTIGSFERLMGPEFVKTGEFGADMKVHLINDGPVTIWIDSKNRE
jgi:D-tyrosyl-tRNA(Tyr) deacylase